MPVSCIWFGLNKQRTKSILIYTFKRSDEGVLKPRLECIPTLPTPPSPPGCLRTSMNQGYLGVSGTMKYVCVIHGKQPIDKSFNQLLKNKKINKKLRNKLINS